MATSSARMMVRVSSVPPASINILVEVGMCTIAAPNLGYPSMSELSVYTQFSGMNFGVHGCGTGGKHSLLGERVMDGPVKGGRLSSSGDKCADV